MFSNRLWIVKLALALGLFLLVCRLCAQELSAIHPDSDWVALPPPDAVGKTVFLFARRVRAHTPDGFIVDHSMGPYRIVSATRPESGERVSVRARILGPRLLQAEAWQSNEGHALKRPLNYVLSVLVVIVVLWMFRGLFRVPIREGLFRSRY